MEKLMPAKWFYKTIDSIESCRYNPITIDTIIDLKHSIEKYLADYFEDEKDIYE